MTRTFIPEDFDTLVASGAESAMASARDVESERLGAFEKGYKAGWDDSVAALSEDRKAVSADLAANLADLSFTYHEARSHVLRQLESLVIETFARILPDCAQRSLPHLVWSHVNRIAMDAAGTPITVLVAPGVLPLLESLLPVDPGLPLTLVEEPTLTSGQIFIRSQKGELAVDQAAAIAGIETAVRQFFEMHAKDEEGMLSHG